MYPHMKILQSVVRGRGRDKGSTWISRGDEPLTVQPTELQVPSISLTVPASVRAMERSRMIRAMSITWSNVTLPSCLTCFTCEVPRGNASAQVRSGVTLPTMFTTSAYRRLAAGSSAFPQPAAPTFLRSRGGSLSAFRISEAADGTTATVA